MTNPEPNLDETETESHYIDKLMDDLFFMRNAGVSPREAIEVVRSTDLKTGTEDSERDLLSECLADSYIGALLDHCSETDSWNAIDEEDVSTVRLLQNTYEKSVQDRLKWDVVLSLLVYSKTKSIERAATVPFFDFLKDGLKAGVGSGWVDAPFSPMIKAVMRASTGDAVAAGKLAERYMVLPARRCHEMLDVKFKSFFNTIHDLGIENPDDANSILRFLSKAGNKEEVDMVIFGAVILKLEEKDFGLEIMESYKRNNMEITLLQNKGAQVIRSSDRRFSVFHYRNVIDLMMNFLFVKISDVETIINSAITGGLAFKSPLSQKAFDDLLDPSKRSSVAEAFLSLDYPKIKAYSGEGLSPSILAEIERQILNAETFYPADKQAGRGRRI